MAGLERNVAGQALTVFAFDVVTGLGRTGDAANLIVYYSLADGTLTQLNDTTATELSATNAPGYYRFDLLQAETAGRYVHFFARSTTTSPNNVGVVAVQPHYTVPANFSTVAMRGTDSALLAASAPSNFTDLAITVSTGLVTTGTNQDKTGYSISGTKTTLDVLQDLSAAAAADAVADESRTGHAIAGSFGEVWSSLPAAPAGTSGGLATYDNLFSIVLTGSVNDAGALAGDFDLNTGLSSTDNFYNGMFLVFTSGPLISQGRKITTYTGASRNVAFTGSAGDADVSFPSAPTNGDSVVLLGFHGA